MCTVAPTFAPAGRRTKKPKENEEKMTGLTRLGDGREKKKKKPNK
jgi:hypothetical protein